MAVIRVRVSDLAVLLAAWASRGSEVPAPAARSAASSALEVIDILARLLDRIMSVES
jgi:hypothetical protein